MDTFDETEEVPLVDEAHREKEGNKEEDHPVVAVA